jgi:hypothetical protein
MPASRSTSSTLTEDDIVAAIRYVVHANTCTRVDLVDDRGTVARSR